MPLYQMLCISVSHPDYNLIKGLVTTTAKSIMNAGGIVRQIDSWGTLTLPQRMRRHVQYHYTGDYWLMSFDTSPRTLKDLNMVLRNDPMVIRWSIIKQASKIGDLAARGRILKHGNDQAGYLIL